MVIVYLTNFFSLSLAVCFSLLSFILDTGSHCVAPGWPAACYVDQAVRACRDPPVSEMKGLHHYGQPFQHLFKYMHSFVPLLVCLCERMYMCEWVCIPLLSLFTSSLNLGLPRTRACVSATLESCKTQWSSLGLGASAGTLGLCGGVWAPVFMVTKVMLLATELPLQPLTSFYSNLF